MTTRRVLIVQSDEKAAQTLSQLFIHRGDWVRRCVNSSQGIALLNQVHPDLLVVDLQRSGPQWMDLIRQAQHEFPQIKILATQHSPQFSAESRARELGVRVFLREPLNEKWLNRAIDKLDTAAQADEADGGSGAAPRVRMPVRIKITLPYTLLAIAVALVAAYLVSQVVLENIQDRFMNQLVATGKQSADWVTQEEARLLETLRLVANTQGTAEALSAGDTELLRTLALPLAVNSGVDAVEVLDLSGKSVLSLRHVSGGGVEEYEPSRGDDVFGKWGFVRTVLAGVVDQGRDKYAGLVRAPWGDYFYVSGPLLAADGTRVGAVLVGSALPEMTRRMRQDTLAETSLYTLEGDLLSSSLVAIQQQNAPLQTEQLGMVLTAQDQSSIIRGITLPSVNYSEILLPLEVRDGMDVGVMGVALPEQFLTRTSQVTRWEIFILVSAVLLLVIIIGVSLSNQITRPLLKVVKASSEVAHGNLEVKVDSKGNDEVAVLGYTFNYMVAGLQEGSMYRDLLGRTVSPEVREQLRQTFTSGSLRLEGQEAVATVLMTDIRGFTTLSERVDPATVFNWLNEYFGELVPIVTANGGVVNKFDGDAMLAFFGILPRLTSPRQSAHAACRAAVDMMEKIEALNQKRTERGEPVLATGIGVNTGVVTAGGLGAADRMHYTIIGDTVNSTQRLETLTRQVFPQSGVLISEATQQALGNRSSEFAIVPAGEYSVKGKAERMRIYRLSAAESIPVGDQT
ncbi:MAG: adenylate/guanylate cyclase domain-containing protein [Anaerolineaceae bacterium]